MKIATKAGLFVLAALGGSCAFPALAQQLAQDAAVASVAAAAATQVAAQGRIVESQAQGVTRAQAAMPQDVAKLQQGRQAIPSNVTTGSMPKIEMPQMPAPTTIALAESGAMPPALDTAKGTGGKEDAASPKVPDSVKSVVKRLNTATEDVTLEDLNSAREAVAKLDILIDIEKRLNDLAGLRQEREEKSFAGALPASALRGAPSLPGGGPQAAAFVPSAASLEVQRITGAAGRYTALVKAGDGKAALVREGDKAPDGSVVQSITSRGVTFVKDKKSRTVQVKDIAVVSNGR
jgi:type IV pilus biogenesis protein PilP